MFITMKIELYAYVTSIIMIFFNVVTTKIGTFIFFCVQVYEYRPQSVECQVNCSSVNCDGTQSDIISSTHRGFHGLQTSEVHVQCLYNNSCAIYHLESNLQCVQY